MCGIGSLSRATPSSLRDAALSLRLMALGLEERGQDATGFAYTSADKPHPHYWKDDDQASCVAWNAPLPKGIRTAIVHTRFATKGATDRMVNNHPIVVPGITLVHNGICTNDDELFAMLNCERIGEVDSEAIAALLAYGPDAFGIDDPAELLELFEGDAALAWIASADPSVLHLARLESRPLVLAWTRRGDCLAASTAQAIRFASMDADIVSWRTIPEGTYLRVQGGVIIDERPIKLPDRKRYTYTPSKGTTTAYSGSGGKVTYYVSGKPVTTEVAGAAGREVVTTTLASERRARKAARKGKGRGPGGELKVLAGAPPRSFKSELERSADFVSEWDRAMRLESR